MEASSIRVRLPGANLPPVPSARLRLYSDEQLVERFRGGREEAFRVLHDRYRGRLLAYVRHMLAGRSPEDAEDVLQDVFERAARTLRSGGAPGGVRPWLYSVAHNRCIDELRRRVPASPDVLAASRQPAGDTTVVVERRADVARLFGDLRELPELQRSALLMRELQGLSHAELALALDATVPAVKSLLVRARGGLIDAEQARGLPCATVRDDLAATYDRRVKASAQAARHMRHCVGCRSYRAELRRTSRLVAALAPGPSLLPVGLLGRLLGGAGVPAKPGGAALVTAGKVAALLGAATVVTTGAVLEQGGASPGSSRTAPRAGSLTGAPGPAHVWRRVPAARSGAAQRLTIGGAVSSATSAPATGAARAGGSQRWSNADAPAGTPGAPPAGSQAPDSAPAAGAPVLPGSAAADPAAPGVTSAAPPAAASGDPAPGAAQPGGGSAGASSPGATPLRTVVGGVTSVAAAVVPVVAEVPAAVSQVASDVGLGEAPSSGAGTTASTSTGPSASASPSPSPSQAKPLAGVIKPMATKLAGTLKPAGDAQPG